MNLHFNGPESVFFLDETLKNESWRLVGTQRVGLIVPSDPFPCSYGTDRKLTPLVDRVSFGDGYEQLSATGIRAARSSFSVAWNSITSVRARALLRFFSGEGSKSIYFRLPSEYFWWTPPPELQADFGSEPLRIICVQPVTSKTNTFNSVSITAVFEESFQP